MNLLKLFLKSLQYSKADLSSDRIIYIHDNQRNALHNPAFPANITITAKYNWFTFLPKFLFEQFSKTANLFFLFIAIMQQINGISPTNRFGTIIPLSIVLIASAIKELLEDIKRQQQDCDVNNTPVSVFSGTEFTVKKWNELQVGNLVRIKNGEYFPADLIIVSSSEPDSLCYVETSNLDGETNLKIRQGLPETAHFMTQQDLTTFHGSIKSELPNNSLYTYEGALYTQDQEIPLNPDQLLLRGSVLKNTAWVYAIVIFTGPETKLMKNGTKNPTKYSKLERSVNVQIIYLFIILISLAILCALSAYIRQVNGSFESNILYLKTSTAGWKFAANILTFMILFHNFIPLSLIMTMEFVKLTLGQLINSDLDLYHVESDTPAIAKTSNLVEDLGQVDFIFSDKTGTLTCNKMVFKMCTIGGIPYAETVPDDKKITVDEIGKVSGYYDFARLKINEASHPTAPIIKEFLQLLAVCHTVIPEESEDHPGKITYQASSPDEGALVKGAEMLGYQFRTRRPKSVIYVSEGKEYEYAILNICEFNSTRKRMSAIVRDPDGQIKLYIKGADTVILERLGKGQEFVEATSQYLEEYANEGLRTLCLAYRNVSAEEYTQWSQIYNKAAATINNRGAELDKAAELIERDLFLLGATAIEDKLQDGVPDTIYTLAQAGIKIWVLTGDRQETAINIGYSCKLITEDMGLIIVNEKTHLGTKECLQKNLETLYNRKYSCSIGDKAANSPRDKIWLDESDTHRIRKQDIGSISESIALIIDGKSLDFALEDDIKMIFLNLAVVCKAVICCRVSPLQKALVVGLVKEKVNDTVTLAIGDGANDVPMIQAANVGIGISGLEGLQAARSADFSISQFRFLRKLLLVHGSWSYSRISKLVLFSFYKNITLYSIQLWYSTENGFSGQTLFETWTQACYNILFALFQPVAIGLFDQFLSAAILMKYPQPYHLGQDSAFYNNKSFSYWLFSCLSHSIILFYSFVLIYGDGAVLANGQIGSNWTMGEMIFTADLITITIKAALIATTWMKFTFLAIFGSIGLWLLLYPAYSTVAPFIGISTELRGSVYGMMATPVFWFGISLIPVIANIRDILWKVIKINFYPATYHVATEIQKQDHLDDETRMEMLISTVQLAKAKHTQKRVRRSLGFAFSETETGNRKGRLMSLYDTSRPKPKG